MKGLIGREHAWKQCQEFEPIFMKKWLLLFYAARPRHKKSIISEAHLILPIFDKDSYPKNWKEEESKEFWAKNASSKVAQKDKENEVWDHKDW